MDEQTRRDVDEACLRLMGYEKHPVSGWYEPPNVGGWYLPDAGDGSPSPSQEPALVVPLAEALRARGYSVCLFAIRGQWEVTVCHQKTWERAMVDAPTAPEALAIAAARAVGTETER